MVNTMVNNGEQWQNLWLLAYSDYKSWRIDNGD